jgi:hypothetical protein
MKTGLVKSLAFIVGTSLMFTPIAFSVTGCGTVTPVQATQAEKTVALLVEALQSFGVINTTLSNSQINVLVTYLDGTATPDVNVIMADFQSFGVLAHLGLTADQISSIVSLLISMSYQPLIAGKPVHVGVALGK